MEDTEEKEVRDVLFDFCEFQTLYLGLPSLRAAWGVLWVGIVMFQSHESLGKKFPSYAVPGAQKAAWMSRKASIRTRMRHWVGGL